MDEDACSLSGEEKKNTHTQKDKQIKNLKPFCQAASALLLLLLLLSPISFRHRDHKPLPPVHEGRRACSKHRGVKKRERESKKHFASRACNVRTICLCLSPSVFTSLLTSFFTSLPFYLLLYLPPYLPTSLPPSAPPSLPSSLPHSLPPSLPLSGLSPSCACGCVCAELVCVFGCRVSEWGCVCVRPPAAARKRLSKRHTKTAVRFQINTMF